MDSAVALTDPRNAQIPAEIMEKLVISGDLAGLTPAQRVVYYNATCQSLGLNPLTKPFDYISLNGKLTLYAKRDATDQLRALRGISVLKLEREMIEDVYVVTAYGQDKGGRQDTAQGAVAIGNLRGEPRANAMMKAETKAKRRLTLSLVGLGWMDETEVDTIPAVHVVVSNEGEIASGGSSRDPMSRLQSDYKQLEEPPGWEFDGQNARPVAPERAKPRTTRGRQERQKAETEVVEAVARDPDPTKAPQTAPEPPGGTTTPIQRAEGVRGTVGRADGPLVADAERLTDRDGVFKAWRLVVAVGEGFDDDDLEAVVLVPLDLAAEVEFEGAPKGTMIAATGKWSVYQGGPVLVADGLA